ncbi:(2Fe-2S)-binding protein [Paramicrobacterium agarici]|uniref:(2Fe-2S)-binding protein n=1 Tax=Paramicrobacterium agarici TaxID=630514 RepID=UPI001166CDE1|nr:(2Fe-2S)-binding protein [Microbacterium agarici]TQO23029.1 2Fe-2S iron-sulfur cluster protein [Microbacterium agarici]
MTAYRLPPQNDPTERVENERVHITVDGEQLSGPAGSTIAAVLLENGRDSWRTTSRDRRPRGIFCGIGVCYDCILQVGDERDVRACQRRACEGDVVSLQSEGRPDAAGSPRPGSDSSAPASESTAGEAS